jgi:Ca2+-binding EF-hand superfamily protein
VVKQPPKKRSSVGKPSKLAQSLSLTTADESEITDAFALFLSARASDEAGEGAIPSSDVRKALKALGLGPSSAEEMEEILAAVDPDDLGYVIRKRFFEVAALKMKCLWSLSRGERGGA